jgi:hypothetical protein
MRDMGGPDTMRGARPKEIATEYVGRCPACDEVPKGPWTTIGEFPCECGVELYANLDEDDDGTRHWRFTFANEADFQAHAASRSSRRAR